MDRLLTVKAYWRMSGSMSELFEDVCLLAGKADTPMALVIASALMEKKCIVIYRYLFVENQSELYLY